MQEFCVSAKIYLHNIKAGIIKKCEMPAVYIVQHLKSKADFYKHFCSTVF